MTTTPTFKVPAAPGPNTSPLIEVDKALESMRDSGFDFFAAAGEPIDNSVEANATWIRIEPKYSKDRKEITELAFADNGRGIDLAVLPQVLKMGFSTRYDQRKGLGRFGVGLKLAGLSLGRRIEVITKPAGEDKFYSAFLDLDLITKGQQKLIEAVEVDGWPEGHADLMSDASGKPFAHGTLVLWKKVDRLTGGGSYGTSLDSKFDELRKFIARVYRRFLDQGLVIDLAGKHVSLHDPMFQLDDPRMIKQYAGRAQDQVKGKIVQEGDLTIEGLPVHVSVAIAPAIFRNKSGDGGEVDIDGRKIREFQINRDNAGRISIMRNGREIYYDIVPRILPSGVDKIDRYIGIEVSFPAELDKYFQVRNVKRGAEPVSKLREELREWLKLPVIQARKEIRLHWKEVEISQQTKTGSQRSPEATYAVAKAEETSPKGQAGLGMTEEEQNAEIDQIIGDMGIDPDLEPETVEEVKQTIAELPISMVDAGWPGKELMDITHLNGKAIVKLNSRHPFISEVYDGLRKMSGVMPENLDPVEMHTMIRKAWNGLEVLFMAYAKAENLHADPEVFDNLRTYWGQHSQAYMKELIKAEE